MAETKRKDVLTERRELSVEQLEGLLAEAREEEFRLRFRSATEAIESPMRFRALRRDIARIQTVLREMRGQR
jgi:large subunit ribosomal protein L29